MVASAIFAKVLATRVLTGKSISTMSHSTSFDLNLCHFFTSLLKVVCFTLKLSFLLKVVCLIYDQQNSSISKKDLPLAFARGLVL